MLRGFRIGAVPDLLTTLCLDLRNGCCSHPRGVGDSTASPSAGFVPRLFGVVGNLLEVASPVFSLSIFGRGRFLGAIVAGPPCAKLEAVAEAKEFGRRRGCSVMRRRLLPSF
eukprot:scaffold80739_cov80-Cyclotella_meneghiniana.AAC.3